MLRRCEPIAHMYRGSLGISQTYSSFLRWLRSRRRRMFSLAGLGIRHLGSTQGLNIGADMRTLCFVGGPRSGIKTLQGLKEQRWRYDHT